MPGPTADLFADDALQQPAGREQIGEQSYVLRGLALPWIERILPELRRVLAQSPFRQMVTPGGFTMSAALSSCGDLGWTTDTSGYRYSPVDPRSQQPWPQMPEVLRQLAVQAAAQAGFFRLCSRRLPDQPLCARRKNVPAPGQKRASL